jgi:hypothetical protein
MTSDPIERAEWQAIRDDLDHTRPPLPRTEYVKPPASDALLLEQDEWEAAVEADRRDGGRQATNLRRRR